MAECSQIAELAGTNHSIAPGPVAQRMVEVGIVEFRGHRFDAPDRLKQVLDRLDHVFI